MKRNHITEKNGMTEGMNGSERTRNSTNWLLSLGLLVYSITMILKHTVGLSEFLMGFGDGLGIGLMFLGGLAAAGKPVCRLLKCRRRLPADNTR